MEMILFVPEKVSAVMRTTLRQSKFTECKEAQFLKALLSINATLFGMATTCRLVDSNALAPKLFTVDGISMASRLVQDLKADAPIVTMSGLEAKVTVVSEVAPLKAPAIFVTLAGVSIAVRPEPENASLPMLSSSELGAKKIPQSAEQSLKASAAISVTVAGTQTLPSLSTLFAQSRAVQVIPFPATV